jgi:hypothetical protein
MHEETKAQFQNWDINLGFIWFQNPELDLTITPWTVLYKRRQLPGILFEKVERGLHFGCVVSLCHTRPWQFFCIFASWRRSWSRNQTVVLNLYPRLQSKDRKSVTSFPPSPQSQEPLRNGSTVSSGKARGGLASASPSDFLPPHLPEVSKNPLIWSWKLIFYSLGFCYSARVKKPLCQGLQKWSNVPWVPDYVCSTRQTGGQYGPTGSQSAQQLQVNHMV